MKKFTSNSQKIGELGENIACIFLEKHGFEILERNYTRKWGEIDIVARRAYRLYFIEVKAVSRPLSFFEEDSGGGQTNESFSGETNNRQKPEENMHPWKLKRLSRVIQTYLINKRIGNIEWQFDLLLVYLDLKQRKARVKTMNNIIL